MNCHFFVYVRTYTPTVKASEFQSYSYRAINVTSFSITSYYRNSDYLGTSEVSNRLQSRAKSRTLSNKTESRIRHPWSLLKSFIRYIVDIGKKSTCTYFRATAVATNSRGQVNAYLLKWLKNYS